MRRSITSAAATRTRPSPTIQARLDCQRRSPGTLSSWIGNQAGQARPAVDRATTAAMAAAPPPSTDVRLAARNPTAVASPKPGSVALARSAAAQPAVPSSSTARARIAAAPSASQPARRSARARQRGTGPARSTSRGGSVSGADMTAPPTPSSNDDQRKTATPTPGSPARSARSRVNSSQPAASTASHPQGTGRSR